MKYNKPALPFTEQINKLKEMGFPKDWEQEIFWQ